MKKFVLSIATIAIAVSVSAQTVTESKTFDNFYIGINGGLSTATTHNAWFKNLNPNAGLRIGRYFTPVFGMAVEGNAYFSNKPGKSNGTFIRNTNVSALGTVNFSNWFGGYKGQPRPFEVIAIYGLGWDHVYGTKSNRALMSGKGNGLTSKAGFDFAFNLGEQKAWQIYLEPSMNYMLHSNGIENGIKYNINNSFFQVNVGIVYKFKNSNGTNNFTIATLRDQAEVDGLNAKINDLRNTNSDKDTQLASKERTIADLQTQLTDCINKPVPKPKAVAANLQPSVIFRQGKSVIDPAQYASISMIATYLKAHRNAKIKISGYASPEGTKEFNQKLSEERANIVKNALVNRYKISADRIVTEGLGATDKIFDEVEFNRVAVFNDTTK